MQHVLEDEGFATIAAEHGQSALDLLKSGGVRPEVIVLDLGMPIMNGWEFLHCVSRDPALHAIRVVVVAGTERVHHERAWRSLRKPVDLDELLDAVREA